ncbi:MAG: hypothetical protein JKY80_01170 [Mariprofundaceae bacterium]|nr:hypothetical protein [Mariprofundaceae bacterium]
MIYNRNIDDLERNAILWWPEHLNDKNAFISIIPKLLKTQDDFLKIISLSKDNPYQVFDLLEASKFSVNLFLKHLCVLADYGGEPIQRLGRAFSSIFESTNKKYFIDFFWNSNRYSDSCMKLPLFYDFHPRHPRNFLLGIHDEC